MDTHALVDLALRNKWFALAAALIGLVVRLLKSDGPIPFEIPARYRPWAAVVLGVVAAVLDRVAEGTPWQTAIVGGVVAAFAAISGHQLLVESGRGGREFFESKSAFSKRSLPPPPKTDDPS